MRAFVMHFRRGSDLASCPLGQFSEAPAAPRRLRGRIDSPSKFFPYALALWYYGFFARKVAPPTSPSINPLEKETNHETLVFTSRLAVFLAARLVPGLPRQAGAHGGPVPAGRTSGPGGAHIRRQARREVRPELPGGKQTGRGREHRHEYGREFGT